MITTRLSSKGQVIIPKSVRVSRQWQTGQELMVLETADGILLTPKHAFATTTLDNVAGCLHTPGLSKTDTEIELAMKAAARRAWRDSD